MKGEILSHNTILNIGTAFVRNRKLKKSDSALKSIFIRFVYFDFKPLELF